MDFLTVIAIAVTWLVTVVGAYSAGWITGHDVSEANHRWSRWLLRQYENRSMRF